MGSIVHRSVPTNLKWFPNCSHAHALFQDRFKDVQVGSRWFSTLYILSPNFHNRSRDIVNVLDPLQDPSVQRVEFAGFSCMIPFHLIAYGCSLQPAALEHLVRCAHFPYETWVLHAVFCDGWMDGLHLVCKSSWTPIPSASPAGGVLGTPDHRDITTNRGWTTPVLISCGLMHKYIWEDAERGNVCRPVYSFRLWQRSYAQCFNFYVSQHVVVNN